MIYWRMSGGVLLISLNPAVPVEKVLIDMAQARDVAPCVANHVVCRQWVPYGATAWAENSKGPWKEIRELPPGFAEMERLLAVAREGPQRKQK